MNGFGSYLWLEVRRTLRNGRYLMFTLGFPAGFYLLFTMLYGKEASGSGYNFNAIYMASMAAYGALGAAMNSNSVALATERTGGWSRQLRVTPLAPLAYVLGKVVTAICVALPALLLVSVLGVLVHHVQMSAGDWVVFLLATWIGTIPFAALGILLGYAMDPQSAQGGMMIVYFGLSILGGMWFPYQIMPRAMQVMARILPSYHFASLGWNAITGQGIGWNNVGILAAYTLVFGVAAMRAYRRDEARQYA